MKVYTVKFTEWDIGMTGKVFSSMELLMAKGEQAMKDCVQDGTFQEAIDRGLVEISEVEVEDIEATDDWDDDLAKNILENEGTGYAVDGYCGPDSFSNLETRQLWSEARNAIRALEKHLGL